MARLAAIDIGTNSTKMTIADVDAKGALTVVSEASEITRLGEGVDKTHRLNEQAIARTMETLEKYSQTVKESKAKIVAVAGTSALRDAENGGDFLTQVKERLGLSVEIVSGDREATLAYGAVRSDNTLGIAANKNLLVFDIGGGSTELILGDASGVGRHKSLDLGGVRLTERCFHHDPPTDEELNEASQLIDKTLAQFPLPEGAIEVAGIGGTAVTIVAIKLGLPKPDPDKTHGVALSHEDVRKALNTLKSVGVEERRQIPGVEPKRADIIVAGTLILERLLTYIGATALTVSARGLRYGLLAEQADAATEE